jgi:uncharacterized protein (DUF433 family)
MPGHDSESAVFTVNEAAYAAGVPVKVVNQAIDRTHIRTREFLREDERKRGSRGVVASDVVFLRVHQVFAPEYRRKLYQSLRGKSLAQIPNRLEVDSIVLDLEQPISEVRERLQVLQRFKERVEVNPEVRAGEPVFSGTRVPVHAIARKIELGSSLEELREDYPQLEEGDFDLAVHYAKLHPRRGRPRIDG